MNLNEIATLEEIIDKGTTDSWFLVRDLWEEYLGFYPPSPPNFHDDYQKNRLDAKYVLDTINSKMVGVGGTHHIEKWIDSHGDKQSTCWCGNNLPCPRFVAPPEPELAEPELMVPVSMFREAVSTAIIKADDYAERMIAPAASEPINWVVSEFENLLAKFNVKEDKSEDSEDSPAPVMMPWHHPHLDGWMICGLHHYYEPGQRSLFVSLVKDGMYFTQMGSDDDNFWVRVTNKAHSLNNKNNDISESKVRPIESVKVFAAKAVKLAVLLLGERVPDEIVESQARDFMNIMSNDAIDAALERFKGTESFYSEDE